ncbi:MAG: hypothetical protein IPL92_15590 [Saprospiraceae bacterium]|nr:hypothetical protein [Candidatus Opimibacter iunctus]
MRRFLFVTRTWTATDGCGNVSTRSQTINVVDNSTSDRCITCPIDDQLPATPAFATATATDACGSLFTLTFADVTVTPGSCAGSYTVTRTWTATDGCGNVSTAAQVINVQDIDAPVIASAGPWLNH